MGWIDIVGGNELDSFGAKVGEYRRTDESDAEYRVRLRAAASDAAISAARPNDGGQAFPLGASEYGGHGPQAGMTLRDYFAAKAMQSLVAPLVGMSAEDFEHHLSVTHKVAYKIADAMIAERAK